MELLAGKKKCEIGAGRVSFFSFDFFSLDLTPLPPSLSLFSTGIPPKGGVADFSDLSPEIHPILARSNADA